MARGGRGAPFGNHNAKGKRRGLSKGAVGGLAVGGAAITGGTILGAGYIANEALNKITGKSKPAKPKKQSNIVK
jgi:hypothetical protein